MGICSLRTFFLTNCVVQLILTACRQVFDFLGYMWGPIFSNFFQIIFTIFGFFGVYQYRPKYIIVYSVWCVFWCSWNIFVVCFYLNLFGLDKDSDLLSLGTGSVSWWETGGPGCKPVFLANQSLEGEPWRPLRPDFVTDCLLRYDHLEAGQAILHLLTSVFGLISGVIIAWSLFDEDDTFDFLGEFESKSPQHLALQPMYVRHATVPSASDSLLTLTRSLNKHRASPPGKKKKVNELPPLYSIEYSMRRPSDDNIHEPEEDPESRLSSPRPMTPRRVKRRSVNSRGVPLQRPHSTHLSHSQRHSHSRSSARSSQRRHRVSHPSPVTRLIDQQQKQDVSRLVGHTNPMYQQSSSNSLDLDCDRPSSARSVYSNYHGTRAFTYTAQPPSTFLSRGPPAYSPDKTETVI
ncbi:sodium/potassium-transporting ATPase subunit beta-1-interacting protein-like isoform X1 [Macrosteles quadrilineatus]|uniref:sodium/potassium-transporting ATPase subunit beta-1-interacting protein-like isoform X1 n=1 Tax=Macrosteles quadrilineatus TaxID=74068 RepID=UPI0023E28EEB|nr:sodium/potassium-transporting ATPase subunit beta-1-interacting protein-like isoform X1 [Macrosteles quadrilineatus]